MNTRLRAPLAAVLLALLLSGCGGADGGSGTPSSGAPAASSAAPTSAAAKPGEPWFDELKPATSGGKVSATCPLPVDFEVAKLWVPKAISASTASVLGKQAGFTAACEIDAKPAGNLGFLRVWTQDSATSAKQALEAFVTAEKKATAAEHRDTSAGPYPAVETTYLLPDTLSGGTRHQRALAVALPKGVLLLHLGGIDNDEHKQMMPAYLLARSTLTARG